MVMAIDALERRVIRLIRVAIAACAPYAGTMPCARCDREETVVRKECRRRPGQRAMACCTIDGKVSRPVIWRFGGVVFPLMACDALDRRPAVFVVDVALVAGNRIVCAARRELCFIMVEIFKPRLGVRCMALETIGTESCLAMVDECGSLIIFLMASVAPG